MGDYMNELGKAKTIGAMLRIGFAIIVGITALLGGYSLFQVNRLAKLQDEGADRMRDALLASQAEGMGDQDYSIIADLIINRQLGES